MELLLLMKWPLIASLILPWLLVYLGLHIVQRGVIFVDLALAQTAAFGTCVSMLAGYDVHDWQSFACSQVFTFAGAVVLTFTRGRDQRVPQEALIGIVYVVAAAAAILALSKSAGGHEELQRSMVGELLVVPPIEVMKTFGLFVILGVAHFLFRKRFLAISANAKQAEASGIRVRWWDFVFYMLFGLVVTSFVQIGGVLLVFSYLIVPAVCANFLATRLTTLLAIGWITATLSSMLGLYAAYRFDFPTGAAIICMLGVALLLCGFAVSLSKNKNCRQPPDPSAH